MNELFGGTQLYASLLVEHAGLSVLKDRSWPSLKEDDWKYTDLSPLGRSSFSPIVERDVGFKELPEDLKASLSSSAINIVFYNGSYVAAVSSLSLEGVEIGLLYKAGADRLLLKASLFQAMNAIAAPFAYVVRIQPKIAEGRIIHIVHWNDKKLDRKVLFPRLFIHAGAYSNVKILETHFTKDAPNVFVNSSTDIELEKNAVMEFVQIFRDGQKSMHMGSTHVSLKEASALRSFQLMTGAKIFRNDLHIEFKGEGASASVNGLHQLKHKDHADSHTFLEHMAPNTKSDQLYKAILDDVSHSVFHGRIYVHKQAQQTNSYQLNKNLLLSRDARADSKPQLEIFADDVKCSHGAATGQMDEEELFYLQTRAISKTDAVKMLVKGFIDDVVGRVTDLSLRDEVLKAMG